MENTKVNQCRNAMSQILMYYHEALKEKGCLDPNREIATEVANMLKLTEGQKEYIIETSKQNAYKSAIKNLSIILSRLEKNSSVNQALIEVGKENLELLQSLIK